MAEWIVFDGAYVLGAMPPDVGKAYAAWIAAKPDKAGRMEEIVGQVLADFRTGLLANPNVPMDADDLAAAADVAGALFPAAPSPAMPIWSLEGAEVPPVRRGS